MTHGLSAENMKKKSPQIYGETNVMHTKAVIFLETHRKLDSMEQINEIYN